MTKHKILIILSLAAMLTGCTSEFNAVYKSTDYKYKYEYAKEMYARNKFSRASLMFGEVITLMKGTDKAEESLFLYGMATMNNKDYDSAAEIFKKYHSTYPKGVYAEDAMYYIGECMYATVPEPRLDQSPTYAAMKSYQDFMDIYPASPRKDEAEKKLFELQDKLVMKELINARLYFNLGTYFGNCIGGGNNFDACIITSQNAMKDYPFTTLREEFAALIMKSKYMLAVHSVKAKQAERVQDAMDECYGFINEYPDSKERALAEKYLDKCKRYHKGEIDFD